MATEISTRSRRRPRTSPTDDEPVERLGEIAYRTILQGLFDRRVPAGSFISQGELMRILDLPAQPLREALRVLETEGILTIHPRSGIEFLKADLELTRSTFQFRSVIERTAVRVYAETAELADIVRLIDDHNALLERVQTIGATPEVGAEMERLEQSFHGSMIASMRNPLIEVTARRLKNYVALIRLDVLSTTPRVVRTIGEHLEVLDACRARDPDAAERALTYHFQMALQRFLGMA